MTFKLRRPILVGGIGLSFALWAWESLHHSAAQLGEFTTFGAIALGAGFWVFKQQKAKANLQLENPPLNRETVEKAIAQAEAAINYLQAEAESHEANPKLREKVAQLTGQLDRQELCVAVTGGKAAGKTTLMQLLESNWVPQVQQKLHLQETPALFIYTEGGEKTDTAAWEIAIASDLVLFLTNGDLTDTEFQTLQQLVAARQHVVLAFNKQDQYLPEERTTVLEQLLQRVQGVLKEENVVAIAASPNPIKVRQHQSDGSLKEWMEQPQADITSLTDKVSQIITQDSQQLVLATTWRSAMALKAEAKTILNGVRRDRALPVIEQYQWIAAGTAFANPVAALDLLATAAINAQMVVDLGGIYQQKFSLEQGKTVAGTLGSLMLKLGLVELSTQTLGSVLKSNAITYAAGGLVQGVSAAYLTRIAGLSLVEYFQEQEIVTTNSQAWNVEKLGETLKKVFQQNQRVAFLQSFAGQAVGYILPKSPQPEIINGDTAISC